jgi:hypothetical protein
MNPNSHEALVRRREASTLTWRGPALMLFARAACAVGAQAVVAAVFALRASPTPWHDAEPWLPVHGTLIDAGCLALLWRLAELSPTRCSSRVLRRSISAAKAFSNSRRSFHKKPGNCTRGNGNVKC